MSEANGGTAKGPDSAASAGSPRPASLKLAEPAWYVLSYNYWESKREFLLPVDTYPTWCLFAVEDGAFAYEIGDAQGTAGGGSLVLCPPSVPFGRKMISSALTFHFALLGRGEAHTENAENGEAVVSGASVPVSFTPSDRQRLFDTFDKWKRIYALTGIDGYPLLTHYWNDIWKTWCLEHIRPHDPRSAAAVAGDDLMNRAARRLEERCAEPFGVRQLADELGLSPVQLIRRFRAAYNMTPGDYMTALRLERACRLLRETRMTVEQIASACGYATGYYLSRLFAARIGVTPSEYRKRHRV